MSINEQIDLLVNRANDTLSREKRKQLINLYAEGLKNKITEADFAIKKLKTFSGRSDRFETHTSGEDTIEDQRYFYSDAFWAFLYSSLDVMAQLVNHSLSLNLAEDKTDFKKVNGKLQSNEHKSKQVSKLFLRCSNSYTFKRLDKYRNCALHRRHVFLNEAFIGVSGSRGYATGDLSEVVHYLCDDPYKIPPSTTQKREIPDFMVDMFKEIINNIEQILKATMPVK